MTNSFPIRIRPTLLKSEVDQHQGDCVPVWLNTNIVSNRLVGGVTGFFKNVKRIAPGLYRTTGKEFHGILAYGRVLTTTEMI